MRDRQVLGIEELRGGLDLLVLACEVDPEQEAAEGACLALTDLVRADLLRVPNAAAGSELERGSSLESHAFCRTLRTGAVAGAGFACEEVPEVGESTMRMAGVHARTLRADGHDGLVAAEYLDHHRVLE